MEFQSCRPESLLSSGSAAWQPVQVNGLVDMVLLVLERAPCRKAVVFVRPRGSVRPNPCSRSEIQRAC
jgi:hypothetical protein